MPRISGIAVKGGDQLLLNVGKVEKRSDLRFWMFENGRGQGIAERGHARFGG